jgi:hypothetical protein
MKEVIAHYIEVANILDDAGHIQEAQEFTERALRVAQLKSINANQNTVATYKQMIENDAAKAADLVIKGMKGEISKESLKNELENMMQKQQSFKFNEKLPDSVDDVLLNSILKKNNPNQAAQNQSPVFRSVQEAENYYNREHSFKTPQEAQKFQTDKMRFMKSLGR